MISLFKTKNNFSENFWSPLRFIKKSFNLCLKNPQLLFLGFFLIIFINQEFRIIFSILGEINVFFSSVINNVPKFLISQSSEFSDIITLILGTFKNLNGFNLLFLFAILLFAYLTLVSQIYLILWFLKSKKEKKTSFQKLFSSSQKFLLPSVLIYFLSGIIIALFLNIPILFKTQIDVYNQFFNLWGSIYILFSLLLGLFLTLIVKFSIFFIIIKKEKAFSAIKKSIKFFFKNWLSIIKISLFLLIISIIFALLISLIFVGTLVPLSLILKLFLNILSPSAFLILIAILSIIITLISLILLSFWALFQYLTWVLYFSKTVEKM